MTDLPKMTEEQAYQFLDFVSWRISGWEVVDRKKHHPRSKAANAVMARFRNIIMHQPTVDDFLAAAMEGSPVHLLWPEDLRDEVERQINTKVPRAINEPTSEEFMQSMHEHGRAGWMLPDFLRDHGRDA